MGIFDYDCYIENENCPLLNSGGQEFTSGYIYAVNKKLTKKIGCYYSGYGYATLDSNIHSNDKIYDLIYLDYGGKKDDINDKSSYFACPNCAKCIENESNDWNEFYEIPNNIDIIKENIEIYKNKINNFINEKDRIVSRINQINLLLEEEKVKLENEKVKLENESKKKVKIN